MKYKIVDDPKNLCVKCPKSLKEKVFLPKNANCKYYFTIGKLGESLWNKTLKNLKIRDFIFFDPDNKECPVEYNSFYDKHLRDYFRRKSVVQYLRQKHLITDKNEVVCNVEDFNQYRRCLFRLKAEGNCHKKKHENYEDVLKHQFEIYHKNHPCDDNATRPKHVTKNFMRKRIKMEEETRNKFIDNIQRYKDHIKRIELLKSLRDSEIKERGIYRNLEVVKKRIFVLEKRKQRRAQIKRKIFEREEAVKKRLCVDGSLEPVNYIIRCPLKI